MASQVVVISPSARQVVVKTKPETYLNDVLHEACTKLRLNPASYGLKSNNRELDLSNAMRQSGLTPGARLQLSLLSKSPSVVNIALQLPESEAKKVPGQRLTDKFPSDTTLWHVLRKFEAGVAGQAGNAINLTGRGYPKTGGNSGAGRLYYETPVLQNQGRAWQSFQDLQKTLGQLGFVKGNVLFRLTFQQTDTPLETAVEEIGSYFQVDGEEPAPKEAMDIDSEAQESQALSSGVENTQPENTPAPEATASGSSLIKPDEGENEVVSVSDTIAGTGGRPSAVYAPPSSDTPQAARLAHDPADFVPTVEHARVHQALLGRAGINKRLPSDAEIAAQEASQAEKLAATTKVDIKIRFPDQSSAIATFSNQDTTENLFEYATGLLAAANEPFTLHYAGSRGSKPLPKGNQRLIADIGMTNRVLVTLIWDAGASDSARKGRSLKAEVAAQSKQIEVPKPPVISNDEPGTRVNTTQGEGASEKPKGKGVPKWLKLPGKK